MGLISISLKMGYLLLPLLYSPTIIKNESTHNKERMNIHAYLCVCKASFIYSLLDLYVKFRKVKCAHQDTLLLCKSHKVDVLHILHNPVYHGLSRDQELPRREMFRMLHLASKLHLSTPILLKLYLFLKN